MQLGSFFWMCAACLTSSCAEPIDRSALNGTYLGQKPPGGDPELFAPGVVSTGLDELNAVFSPTGDEFYFSVKLPGGYQHTVMVMRLDAGRWTGPEVASFSGRYADADPAFSPDGNRLFFISQRPLEENGPAKDWDIWFVTRTERGWGQANRLHAPVNTDAQEVHPSFTQDGTMYFSSDRDGGLGGFDVYRTRGSGDSWEEPSNLGAMINTPRGEGDSYVAPDGSYLIVSTSREGGYGRNDLWVSFLDAEGEWSEVRNLGGEVNSQGIEYTPQVSRDGRYLFFTSYRGDVVQGRSVVDSYTGVTELYARPENGLGDLYWVGAWVIDSLRGQSGG
jgi:Tol biopolymer transport system component